MIQIWICHLRNKKIQFEIVKDPKQGKSEGVDSWDRPSNLTQNGFKSSIFQLVWPWNLMDDPEKQKGPYSMLL